MATPSHSFFSDPFISTTGHLARRQWPQRSDNTNAHNNVPSAVHDFPNPVPAFRCPIVHMRLFDNSTPPHIAEQVFRDIFVAYETLVMGANLSFYTLRASDIWMCITSNRTRGVLLGRIDDAGKITNDPPESNCPMESWVSYRPVDAYLPNNRPFFHFRRHDLESIFYAIFDYASIQSLGKCIMNYERTDLRMWFIHHHKLQFWFGSKMYPLLDPGRAGFQKWLFPMIDIFTAGFGARLATFRTQNGRFDDATLNGEVTMRHFREILEQRLHHSNI